MIALSLIPLLLAADPGRVLTLEEALAIAKKSRPLLVAARANVRAAEARVDASLAPLLPELNGTASYAQQTGNFVSRPGQLPSSVTQTIPSASFNTFGFWNFGLNASVMVFDFGAARSSRAAQKANRAGLEATREASEDDVALAVRSAYVAAWAQEAMVGVAKASVDAADRHLEQIDAMVQVGTRADLDLAQVKADRASARLTLVNAENASLAARADLARVIGGMDEGDFTVKDEGLAPLEDEDGLLGPLADKAIANRPELRALEAQRLALAEAHDATFAAFFPSLSLASGFTFLGANLDNLTWNWNAQLLLSWSIFKGLQTRSNLRENEASQEASLAQAEEQRLSVRSEVEQARLAVRAAKASGQAAEELDVAAKERLRLAEGRYAAGVGTVIELEDAQVAAATASAQLVQTRYQLAVARAQLLHALGE
ncbi:MAG: TolC family protein [Myxococcota bacterium]